MHNRIIGFYYALTIFVKECKLKVDCGSNAQASNSSPQKSPGFKVTELNKPALPPFMVELSSLPLMIKSILVIGSPSLTMYVPLVLKDDTNRSHIASSS